MSFINKQRHQIALAAFNRCIDTFPEDNFIIRFRTTKRTFRRHAEIKAQGPRYPEFFGLSDEHVECDLDDPFGDRAGFAAEAGHAKLLREVYKDSIGSIQILYINLRYAFSARGPYGMFVQLVTACNAYTPLFEQADEQYNARLHSKKGLGGYIPFSMLVSKNGTSAATLRELRPKFSKP